MELEGDFTAGHCLNGGIGCVTSAYNHCEGASAPVIPKLDVHYLLANTRDKHVDIGRVTVIPMPYRTQKPKTRPRTSKGRQAANVPTFTMITGYAKFTPIGR